MVDDERIIADSLVDILNQHGFEATPRYSGVDAAEYLENACPDILLSDVAMPKVDGITLALAAHRTCPTTRIVLISGQAATVDYLERIRSEGFQFEFLPKPIHPADLLKHLRTS